MTMAYRTVPAVDRFNAKTVAKESGCIEWTAARNNRGYGTFRADGRSVMAHRWSYEHCRTCRGDRKRQAAERAAI